MLPQLPRAATGAAVLLDLAAERGVAPGRLLVGTGIPRSLLDELGAEIPPTAELTVVRNLLAELGPGPGLGLVAGQRFHLGLFGIWGFALLTSRTVRDAVELGVRFADLTFSFARIRLTTADGEPALEFDDSAVPGDVREFLLERDIASALRLMQDVLREPLPDIRLELSLPLPADDAVWSDLTGISPRFDAPRNLIVLPSGSMDRPLPQANHLVTTATREQCAALLRARRERVGVAGEVRKVLLTGPPALFRQEQVAAAVHQSPRTLHRRLAAEGTTYRDLVTETVVLLAQELLGTGMTVESVAGRLGYAGAPAFAVAFRNATGSSPGAWARAQHPRRSETLRT